MEENKEAIPAAQLVPEKRKCGRPKLQLTETALEKHRKALKKARDARYHKKLREGLTKNPAAFENWQTRQSESVIKMQEKKAKVLIL